MAGKSEGGAETFFMDAMEALNHAGIEQHVIVHKKNHGRAHKINALALPYTTAPFHTIFRWITRNIIKKTIDQFQPDIVQYWMGRASSFAVKGNHINIGWHGGYYNIKRFRNCDAHITVTDDVALHLVKQGIHSKDTYTLPIYTKRSNGKKIDRESLSTPNDAPLLLCMARLDPVKGLDVLLNAMTHIPEAYLWLAGSGPLEQELKQQCSALGLNERVRFLGWRNDGEDLTATADICVFPSRNDSFGAVMIEAWAAHKPFVATKAPGPKAYINDGEDGLLVDVDDVDGLADAMNKLISDPELQRNLTDNGYKRFKNEFTQEAFLSNALRIYEALSPRK